MRPLEWYCLDLKGKVIQVRHVARGPGRVAAAGFLSPVPALHVKGP